MHKILLLTALAFLFGCKEEKQSYQTEYQSQKETDANSEAKKAALRASVKEAKAYAASKAAKDEAAAAALAKTRPTPSEEETDFPNEMETITPSEAEYQEELGIVIDNRDGKKYKTVKINEQVWMAENLNFELYGNNECYGGKQANCKKYGRLYIWEDATKFCLNGWHLPNNEEWDKLFNFAGGREIAGKFLKATSDWEDEEGKTYNGEDKFGFAALPGGIVYNDVGYNSIGVRGSWWSSSKNEYSIGYYCRMEYDDVKFIVEEDANSLSVRCIKD